MKSVFGTLMMFALIGATYADEGAKPNSIVCHQ
jgi:hypothetical protein